MKSYLQFKLFLLFFCSTKMVSSANQLTQSCDTFSNYITSYQNYYIQNQNSVIQPIHPVTILSFLAKDIVDEITKLNNFMENYWFFHVKNIKNIMKLIIKEKY